MSTEGKPLGDQIGQLLKALEESRQDKPLADISARLAECLAVASRCESRIAVLQSEVAGIKVGVEKDVTDLKIKAEKHSDRFFEISVRLVGVLVAALTGLALAAWSAFFKH